jgi:hypothetical protein
VSVTIRLMVPLAARHLLAVMLVGLCTVKLLSVPVEHDVAMITAVALVEGLLGIALLTRFWRSACFASLLLMLSFMVVANRGLVPTCACLGTGFKVDPSQRFWIAAFMGALSAVAVTRPR